MWAPLPAAPCSSGGSTAPAWLAGQQQCSRAVRAPAAATARHNAAAAVATAALTPATAASIGAAAAVPVQQRQLDEQHVDGDGVPAAFDSLAAALAPRCSLHAGPTPLGRGLVASADIAAGELLLAVDRGGLLCVTDDPAGAAGDAFGRQAIEEWQLLPGRLPPLLLNYLLSAPDGGGGQPSPSSLPRGWFPRMVAWLLHLACRSPPGSPWRLYTRLLPRVGGAALCVQCCARSSRDPVELVVEASFPEGRWCGGAKRNSPDRYPFPPRRAQEREMSCLMNYDPATGLAAELQDAKAAALAVREREQITGLHERCVPGGGL